MAFSAFFCWETRVEPVGHRGSQLDKLVKAICALTGRLLNAAWPMNLGRPSGGRIRRVRPRPGGSFTAQPSIKREHANARCQLVDHDERSADQIMFIML